MPTLSQNSPLPVNQNLTLRQLADRNDFRNVYDLSGGYAKFSMIVRALNLPFGGSKQFDTDKYEKAVMGRGHVIGQSDLSNNPPVQVGNIVKVTILPQGTPPAPYNNFRVGDKVVGDDFDYQGKVVNTTVLGNLVEVEIEPIGTTTALLATALGTATWLKVFSDSSPNFYSDGKSPLREFPEVMYNYASIKRDTYMSSRRENTKSRVEINGEYWGDGQLDVMVQRFLRNLEKDYLFSGRDQWNSQVGGESDSNGGVRWSIINRGGEYLPLTSAPTQSQFENFLANVWNRKAGRKNPMMLAMGRGMKHYIQRNFTAGFIEQAGTMNTFGGAGVEGLNVDMYAVAGTKFMFLDLDVLNDTEFFPELTTIAGLSNPYRQQHTTFALDLDDIPVKGGGKAPAIELIHRGDSEFYCGYLKGIDQAGIPTVENFADYKVDVVTSIDASRCDILADNGIDMVGKFSGLMELRA